jgi:hypothetical protein
MSRSMIGVYHQTPPERPSVCFLFRRETRVWVWPGYVEFDRVGASYMLDHIKRSQPFKSFAHYYRKLVVVEKRTNVV